MTSKINMILEISNNPDELKALIDISKGSSKCVLPSELLAIGDLRPNQEIEIKHDHIGLVIKFLPAKSGRPWTHTQWISDSLKGLFASNDAVYGD